MCVCRVCGRMRRLAEVEIAAAAVAAAAVAPAADGWQRINEVEKGGRAKAANGEVLDKRDVRRRRRGRCVRCVRAVEGRGGGSSSGSSGGAGGGERRGAREGVVVE